MSTLLLRLAAPLQSWGSSSRFNMRGAGRAPTKSAVIGMLAAALGRRRDEGLNDLCTMHFGVRVDQVGELLSDFHTAHTTDGKQSFVSNRHYLCDALFLVGIEAPDDKLTEYEQALCSPAFPLFLGRRSCPHTGQLVLGIKQDLSLIDALTLEPWLAAPWYRKKQGQTVALEIIYDADFGNPLAYMQNDIPISFNQEYRRYSQRSVVSTLDGVVVENPDGRSIAGGEKATGHDAFAALEVD